MPKNAKETVSSLSAQYLSHTLPSFQVIYYFFPDNDIFNYFSQTIMFPGKINLWKGQLYEGSHHFANCMKVHILRLPSRSLITFFSDYDIFNYFSQTIRSPVKRNVWKGQFYEGTHHCCVNPENTALCCFNCCWFNFPVTCGYAAGCLSPRKFINSFSLFFWGGGGGIPYLSICSWMLFMKVAIMVSQSSLFSFSSFEFCDFAAFLITEMPSIGMLRNTLDKEVQTTFHFL